MQGAPESPETPSPLLALLSLARRARHAADSSELAFIAVNESFRLAPYRQAVLWLEHEGVRAISGVSSPEANAPFTQWIEQVAVAIPKQPTASPLVLTVKDLPQELSLVWNEWLPAHALWLPFVQRAHAKGALLLAREDAWHDAEIALLAEWIDSWAHAWQLKNPPTSAGGLKRFAAAVTNPQQWRQAPKRLAAALGPDQITQTLMQLWRIRTRRYSMLACAALLIPVKLTVLAPAELVPKNPTVVRAPLDGVVSEVFVQPNQHVAASQPLFALDRTTLQSRLSVAIQALATAQAEYRQQAQLALFDDQSKSQLSTLQGAVSEREMEVAFLEQQLDRSTITASKSGVVLFDDPSEWLGRPVSTGERLAVVANEHDAELEAWLAPGDLISLPESASVKLYLNTTPLSPVTATLRYVSYAAAQRPDGSFAYRLRATLAEDARPRVGLKGTAKVSGRYVPVVYWILRRPLALMRQTLGL